MWVFLGILCLPVLYVLVLFLPMAFDQMAVNLELHRAQHAKNGRAELERYLHSTGRDFGYSPLTGRAIGYYTSVDYLGFGILSSKHYVITTNFKGDSVTDWGSEVFNVSV